MRYSSMPAATLLACSLAVSIAPSHAAAQAAPRVEHAQRYAPTAVPDRVVLTWTGDPKTSAAVTWRTSTAVTRAIAEIARADHGPQHPKAAMTVDAATEAFTSDLSTAHVHTAEFTGLEPGTVYVYRVGDGVNFSEWHQFTTEPAATEPFSFVYFGDAQNDIRSMWSRVTREAFREAPRAAFFLHAGDLVNRADADGEWGEWFEAGSFINASIPVIATPGNHEYTKVEQPDGTELRGLTPHFPAVFAFPRNGPSGLESSVYYIDYADTRLISLNSNERLPEQAEWLESTLANNDRRWTIVTFHHPVFSMGKDRDNPVLRELWKPVLDRHAVDLVLTGHDHTYARTDLIGLGHTVAAAVNSITNPNSRTEAGGTVYVVSVSGPKMYDAKVDTGVDVIRRAEDTQLFQVITIDGGELRYEARTAIGDLYDAFTLRKRDGAANELIEGAITMPERRR